MPRILIADDEKAISDIFSRFLGLKGHQIIIAQDGQEAVSRLNTDNFDILIIDLKMPKIRGIDILKQIKERKKDIAVIILTGTLDAEEFSELAEMGYSPKDILYKPVDLFEFLSLVENKLLKHI